MAVDPDLTGTTKQPQVGIVGPSAAGKSTLISNLKIQGITALHIAQEHSYVPDMWSKLSKPNVLIYLDVSYSATLRRRPQKWLEREYLEEINRLNHAKEHADLYIHTDDLTPDEVSTVVLNFLNHHKIPKIQPK